MKKYLILTALSLAFIGAKAQGNIADSGVFFLHKFEQHIGRETYHISKSGNIVSYADSFKFVDRGSPVPLKTVLKVTSALEPVELDIKGNVARGATINDTVTVSGGSARIKVDDSAFTKKAGANTFAIAGYAPGIVQQALVAYWKKHGGPASITMLPFGSVEIKRSGIDAMKFNGKKLEFERYTLSGLVWGNELLWTDRQGHLMCLITNDAEADKLEMMRDTYESLLPEFISRAAVYSMALFEKAMPKAGNEGKIIAVTGGTMVDVVNGTTVPNSVVIIDGGIIKKVGKQGEVTIPAGAKVIDATGKTILPGLWDMHAHFEQAEWGPAYLAAGVTTVRDCGNEFGYINAIKNAIDGGKGIGPLILKAGIIDGKGPYALGIIQADTKEEAIKCVDRYYNNGFIQIKIYSSVKPAIVKAICDEAHRLGLTVTGHIPFGMTLQQGVDSGMDMVNHVQYVYAIMKRNKDRSTNFEDPTSVAAIKFIADHHVVIDPTVGVFEMSLRSVKDDITEMEPNFYTLPVPLQALFKNTGVPAATAPRVKPIFDSFVKIVKVLYDAGVPIVAGTDQGFPGFSVDRELELYVQAGLTPMQAIQTATITPAKVMKMDKQTGSIEEGKRGDITIIDGDPLANIREVRKVAVVIKDGRIYDPHQLHLLVGFSK